MSAELAWRFASLEDLALLAEWNKRLIRDEGHRNPMTGPELSARMKAWLEGEYKAVIFSLDEALVGYALYNANSEAVNLRQFFIVSEQRRHGLGRAGINILREKVWPKDVRLAVDVLYHNAAAIAFWRAMGYREYCLSMEILPDS